MLSSRIIVSLSLIIFILVLSGCAINNVEIKNAKILEGKKTVYIYAYDDGINLKNTIKKGLIKIGFTVADIKEEANLNVDYKARCDWDVFHYTCVSINLFISDIATNEIIIHAKYIGSVPFSLEDIIQNLFKKIEEKMKSGE